MALSFLLYSNWYRDIVSLNISFYCFLLSSSLRHKCKQLKSLKCSMDIFNECSLEKKLTYGRVWDHILKMCAAYGLCLCVRIRFDGFIRWGFHNRSNGTAHSAHRWCNGCSCCCCCNNRNLYTRRERETPKTDENYMIYLVKRLHGCVILELIKYVHACCVCVVGTVFCFHCQPTAEIQRFNKLYMQSVACRWRFSP